MPKKGKIMYQLVTTGLLRFPGREPWVKPIRISASHSHVTLTFDEPTCECGETQPITLFIPRDKMDQVIVPGTKVFVGALTTIERNPDDGTFRLWREEFPEELPEGCQKDDCFTTLDLGWQDIEKALLMTVPVKRERTPLRWVIPMCLVLGHDTGFQIGFETELGHVALSAHSYN